MEATWILVADRSRARIFEEIRSPRALYEIEDFVNPLGRASDRELTTDAAGRSLSTGLRTRSHSTGPGVGAATHEAERFSKEIADYLETARTDHRYDRLWVVAAPTSGKSIRSSRTGESAPRQPPGRSPLRLAGESRLPRMVLKNPRIYYGVEYAPVLFARHIAKTCGRDDGKRHKLGAAG
jgi:protein required for attachment to host cells